MIVGVCSVELHFPGAQSLKEKRQVMRSLTARLHQKFNVSVAEVGGLDKWQWAELGIACVSNDRAYAHGLLTKAVRTIEGSHLNVTLVDYRMEFL
jgi:hypothetical protein